MGNCIYNSAPRSLQMRRHKSYAFSLKVYRYQITFGI